MMMMIRLLLLTSIAAAYQLAAPACFHGASAIHGAAIRTRMSIQESINTRMKTAMKGGPDAKAEL